MRGSDPRMNTTINFVKHLNGFSAQGQEFFVRRQGHGSILSPVLLHFTSGATRRGDYIGIGLAPAILSCDRRTLTS
jgi:hypothetical protein